MNNAVEVIRCSKSFKNNGGNGSAVRRVFEDVSFTSGLGEITCLLGQSGCGKSTLLRMCAGLDTDYHGELLLNPEGGFAYIPQQNTLFPWLTIGDNMLEPLRLAGVRIESKHRLRVQRVLEQTGLSDSAQLYLYQCSGGMRQRAMLARELMLKRKLWLLDEIFSSLDELTRSELQQLLLRLQRSEGLTVLMVTHDISEAIVMGKRILVMASPARGELSCIDNKKTPQPNTAEFDSVAQHIRHVLRCG